MRESPALLIAIAVVASCLLSGAICLFLKRSMKTVHQKVEANEYVAPGGLQLSKQYDRYTHTTEVRSKISSSDDSSSSGTSSCWAALTQRKVLKGGRTMKQCILRRAAGTSLSGAGAEPDCLRRRDRAA